MPPSDQSLSFGEMFVPEADPNWIFLPPEPTADYNNAGRSGQVSQITAKLSGEAGSPSFVPSSLLPNIDFAFIIKMERIRTDDVPKIRASVKATHNLYPAYEAVFGKADGTYENFYKMMPDASVLPGPVSLNNSVTVEGETLDIN